jgi:hypothetical protein
MQSNWIIVAMCGCGKRQDFFLCTFIHVSKITPYNETKKITTWKFETFGNMNFNLKMDLETIYVNVSCIKNNSKLVFNPKKCFSLSIHYEMQHTYN